MRLRNAKITYRCDKKEVKLRYLSPKYLIILFVAPFFVAGAVYLFESRVPDKYVSAAQIDVLGNLNRADFVMHSPLVTEAESVKSIVEQEMASGGSPVLAGRFRFDQSRVDVNNVPPFLTFQVTSVSPAGAQALSNALIDAWLVALKPKGEAKAKLEERLASTNQEFANVAASLEGLAALQGRSPSTATSVDERELEYHLLAFEHRLTERDRALRTSIKSIEDQINGPRREDVVIVAPSLPSAPERSDATVYAILAFVATFAFLIFAYFVKMEFFRNRLDEKELAKAQR